MFINNSSQPENRAWELPLIILIAVQAVFMCNFSLHREFNFDEFQVLYASASLLRGKALYHDNIGNHFPLVNILFSIPIKIWGNTPTILLTARIAIILFVFSTLFLTYKTAEMLESRLAGLMAVALTMLSITFLNKGLEIRHDVFNMAFNVAGVYSGIKFLKTKKLFFLGASGLFLGLALASTQKAIVWNLGIIVGMCFYMFQEGECKQIFKALLLYSLTIFLPLLVSLAFLLLNGNETIHSFFNVAIKNILVEDLLSKTETIYPFLYSKWFMLKVLLFQNAFFYFLSVVSIILHLLFFLKSNKYRVVIVSWACAGLAFYLTMKRPFFQNFLPSIPALAILTAFLLVDIKNGRFNFVFFKKKNLVTIIIIVLLVGWPLCLTARNILNMETISNQMGGISFCIENLNPGEKVVSFTQQQIFFDPLFRMSGDKCGNSISEIDADCFETEMIRSQTRVVFNDYRSQLLNQAVRSKINDNFISIADSNVFIPGFRIKPNEEIKRNIWIAGTYYSQDPNIMINGKNNNSRFSNLEQKTYIFKNPNNTPVLLHYTFR